MIALPAGLNHFMQGQNLTGLKPFALLFRNKWNAQTSKYGVENTPIDISGLIVKPNTLSMTLDVNEVAQYNANNVTLTLADTQNAFVEGTPNSYFPDGYQLYGSRVVLYYGLDGTNRTPLFTGVIKDLPTHKPENYHVELKLVSPLEMLKDIEAKGFSNTVTGEVLLLVSEEDGNPIYQTSGVGIGGFDGVYANGVKLFEGVDYEISQTNQLGAPALVTLINAAYYSQTLTADYYTWKTGLTVEQIVTGLVGLAGYDSTTEDIRNVVWNTKVRTGQELDPIISLGYKKGENGYVYSGGGNAFYGGQVPPRTTVYSQSIYPSDFSLELTLAPNVSFIDLVPETFWGNVETGYGFSFHSTLNNNGTLNCAISRWEGPQNYVEAYGILLDTNRVLRIIKNGNNVTFTGTQTGYQTVTIPWTIDLNYGGPNLYLYNFENSGVVRLYGQKLTDNNTGVSLQRDGLGFSVSKPDSTTWSFISASLFNSNNQIFLEYRTNTTNEFEAIGLKQIIGKSSSILQFRIGGTDFDNMANFYTISIYYLATSLLLQLVNLSGRTVLEALQDFALISGYEFGVDRQGVFFFRPRISSTTPTYVLDHNEIVKVDTVKKNLSDFFTKLTLTFAQIPLEFYANTGDRPTPIDKYGVINKEIDKPDIVNYDNPELAQAIGPQLLEVYAALPNVIQATGKLNLALELGDIVSFRRNYPLIRPESATDYEKYINQNTYYRACKITGMNYNFAKKQITYTMRDVSNTNTAPLEEPYEFVYDLPIKLGVK